MLNCLKLSYLYILIICSLAVPMRGFAELSSGNESSQPMLKLKKTNSQIKKNKKSKEKTAQVRKEVSLPRTLKKMDKTSKKKKIDSKPVSTPETLDQAMIPKTELLYPEEIGKDLSEEIVTLANRLDSFFGDPRADDEKNGSTLRLSPAYTFYDGKPGIFELGINLNLKLRNLEKKGEEINKSIQDFVNGEKDKLLSNEDGESGAAPKSNKPEEAWLFNFESKLAARPAIYYSGKFRARRNYESFPLTHHFSVEAGWDTDHKWSELTVLNSDRELTSKLLFRIVNEVALYISEQNVLTTHGPSLLQTVNQYNSISYNARVNFGLIENRMEHVSSAVNIDFRNGTPSKKVFIDIVPEYSYPRTNGYEEVRSLYLKIEFLFGDL